MEIILNSEKEQLDRAYTLTELVKKYELSPEIVTVSLNGEVLDRSELDTKAVKDGDSVDILMFMGGGR